MATRFAAWRLAQDSRIPLADVRRLIRLGVLIPYEAGMGANGGIRYTPAAYNYLVTNYPHLIGTGEESPTPDPAPIINGITPQVHSTSAEDIFNAMIEKQKKVEERIQLIKRQTIHVPCAMPFAIANISDFHLGNEYTDYRSLKHDIEVVRDTDGMYAGMLGDPQDNWITQALMYIQRKQSMPLTHEYVLSRWVADQLIDSGKWLFYILGNHGERTPKLAGIDAVQEFFRDVNVLYDADEVTFRLSVGDNGEYTEGDAVWRIKARHKWPGGSRLNMSHSMEQDLRAKDAVWDIALGAHVHSGTFYRPFQWKDRKALACVLGTYKLWDRYGVENNFAQQPQGDRGAGAIVFYPDGRYATFDNLLTARDFLAFARQEWRGWWKLNA